MTVAELIVELGRCKALDAEVFFQRPSREGEEIISGDKGVSVDGVVHVMPCPESGAAQFVSLITYREFEEPGR